MLFNSYVFIFAFLPTVLTAYFVINKQAGPRLAKYWLLSASIFFYGYWNPIYLLLLGSSILVNFGASVWMERAGENERAGLKRHILIATILFNVGLLGYFKYRDFFVGSVNFALGTEFPLLHMALPLAISFFSLQQIAFAVDSYRGLTQEKNFADYMLFVSFFPQLIAGPIVHHKEVMPQFAETENKSFHIENFTAGCFLFAIGLFKKVVVADSFAGWANYGFDQAPSLNVVEAWITSYSYSFQLYFDFSGYSDIAIGLGLMFNIVLPLNFNSPYKAASIINLWQRWHLTLTRFINLYIYRPVLRARKKRGFSFGWAMFATVVAMEASGIWHGAAWTFVVFGFMHGFGLVINHIWRRRKWPFPAWLGWLITFNFANISLVLFRAQDWATVGKVLSSMFGFGDSGFSVQKAIFFPDNMLFQLVERQHFDSAATLLAAATVLLFVGIVKLCPNSQELQEKSRLTPRWLLFQLILLLVPLTLLQQVSQFIYFQF
jgi:alginate O-acetyltransferase complex protein AlgI